MFNCVDEGTAKLWKSILILYEIFNSVIFITDGRIIREYVGCNIGCSCK